MLHSVGCPQPKPEVFAKIWETSTGACVHAVTGADAYAIQCLPLFPERKRLEEDGMEQVERMAVSTTHIYLLK